MKVEWHLNEKLMQRIARTTDCGRLLAEGTVPWLIVTEIDNIFQLQNLEELFDYSILIQILIVNRQTSDYLIVFRAVKNGYKPLELRSWYLTVLSSLLLKVSSMSSYLERKYCTLCL